MLAILSNPDDLMTGKTQAQQTSKWLPTELHPVRTLRLENLLKLIFLQCPGLPVTHRRLELVSYKGGRVTRVPLPTPFVQSWLYFLVFHPKYCCSLENTLAWLINFQGSSLVSALLNLPPPPRGTAVCPTVLASVPRYVYVLRCILKILTAKPS